MFKPQQCALLVSLVCAGQAYAANVPEFAGDPVVVTATRQPQEISKTLSDVSVITREEIEESGVQTLPQLLARQPGVQFSSNGGPGNLTSLYLRGTSANHTVVLIDGVRIVSATQGVTALQNIPVEQIERIEVLRGPASSLYGADAIGGVVQIFTRKGEGIPRVNINLGVGDRGTFKAGAGVRGKSGNTAYSLQVSHAQSDGFSSQNANADTAFYVHNPDRDGYQNDSYTASLTQTLAKGHDLTLRLYQTFAKADHDESPAGQGQDRTDTKLTGQSLESRNVFSDIWTSTLRFAHSQDKQETFTKGNYDRRASLFQTTQNEWLWQNDLKTQLGQFAVGVNHTKQAVAADQVLTKNERTQKAVFVTYQGEFGSHLLQASVRRDHDSQFGGKNTGQLGYGYHLTENWLLRGSYGTAYKAPTFNDLYYPYVSYGSFGSYSGNPNLKPETAQNKELALEYRKGSMHFTATAFHNRISNLISYVADDVGNGTMMNVSKATIRGISLDGRAQWLGLSLSANATFLDGRDDMTGRWLARRARQQANATVSKDWERFTVGGEWSAVGQRYDDPANQKPLHGYAVANIYADYRFAKAWTATARVDNVFNREYQRTNGFNTGGTGAFIGVRYAQ